MPPLVQNAMKRMQENFSKPAQPIMTQEEFEALSHCRKCILTCNVIGCGKVVCTHGMLCVEHTQEMRMDTLDRW